jgi:hypothetical protein
MMRKTLVALVALAAIGFGSTAAFAHGPGGHMGGMGGHMGGMGGGHFGGGHFGGGHFGGGHFGGGHFGGHFGGFHGGFHRHVFVGFGFGPSYYGGYPYYDDEGCYLVRRRVLTPYGWRIRRVEVCS